tara:strand:+ start:101 stop:469 length:369 start_codon:yes stop_codon:yes gene_type:complete
MIKNVSKLNLSSGSLLVPGRCRLAAIQLAIAAPNNLRPRVEAFDFDKMKIELSNGSASGDVLFGLCPPLGGNFGYSIMPFYYEFGNARILFTDGIYSKLVNADLLVGPDPSEIMISVFYEGT